MSDPTGAVVPGADVKAVDRATGVYRETGTTTAGRDSFTDLARGVYSVTVSQTGFQTVVRELAPVEVDRVIEVNAGLSTGVFAQRPVLVCDPENNMPRRAEGWVSPACFAAPASGVVPGTALA